MPEFIGILVALAIGYVLGSWMGEERTYKQLAKPLALFKKDSEHAGRFAISIVEELRFHLSDYVAEAEEYLKIKK